MSPVSHQTIKLGKGKHGSPEEGACVMELASMLAGEKFSDQPRSVCPVIGSFLRAYNDAIDDQRRQDLYAYAAKVVGSRSDSGVQRARTERLATWTSPQPERRIARVLWHGRRLLTIRLGPSVNAGAHAVNAISTHTRETHAAALALIDELLAIGPERFPLRGSPEIVVSDSQRSGVLSPPAI